MTAIMPLRWRGALTQDPRRPGKSSSGRVTTVPPDSIYAAAKRFTDDGERISFMMRFNKVMPSARNEPKYAKYRNDEAATMLSR